MTEGTRTWIYGWYHGTWLSATDMDLFRGRCSSKIWDSKQGDIKRWEKYLCGKFDASPRKQRKGSSMGTMKEQSVSLHVAVELETLL